MNDEGLRKLQIEHNPMEKKKIEVKFPDKKKSPLKFKKEYIQTLHNKEKTGWYFIEKHESKLSLLTENFEKESFAKRRFTIEPGTYFKNGVKTNLNLNSEFDLG